MKWFIEYGFGCLEAAVRNHGDLLPDVAQYCRDLDNDECKCQTPHHRRMRQRTEPYQHEQGAQNDGDVDGAGQSSDLPEKFGIGDWADCLAVFLDAAGVQRAHVLGLSWGGILAQEFYRRHSARVWSLVLADTYAGWKGSLPEPIPEERLAACLRDASLPPSEFVPRYLPGMFSESATADVQEELASIMSDFHPSGFRLMATASAHADTRDLLPNIGVPTLLIWGDADVRSPIRVAHQLHDAIPGARLAIISGAGHVSNFEAPARFDAEVRNFCLSVSFT